MLGAGIALDRALAGVLAGCGARAVRVVDGTGAVVAALPSASGSTDDPGTVARLVSDAVVLGRGGLDDVLVTTASAQHLLRPVPVGPAAVPGAFLHLTADLDVDAAVARRRLADPGLHAAVAAVLVADRVPRNAGDRPGAAPTGPARPAGRVPRNAPAADPPGRVESPNRVPRNAAPRTPTARRATPAGAGELPALAGLVADSGRTGHGARAVQALALLVPAARVPDALAAVVPERRVPVPLPRRSPSVAPPASRAAATGLPERSWAGDLDTMRRLLVGLRRLA